MSSKWVISSRSYLTVMERKCPLLLKEEFMVSHFFRVSVILFWSEVGRGDSQLYWRREYLGEQRVIVMLGTVSSELGINEAFVL